MSDVRIEYRNDIRERREARAKRAGSRSPYALLPERDKHMIFETFRRPNGSTYRVISKVPIWAGMCGEPREIAREELTPATDWRVW